MMVAWVGDKDLACEQLATAVRYTRANPPELVTLFPAQIKLLFLRTRSPFASLASLDYAEWAKLGVTRYLMRNLPYELDLLRSGYSAKPGKISREEV